MRDLGWGISNSPNPWKQGSAKRVVRALDYSNVHEDAAEVAPAPAVQAWEGGQENDPRLQHDSRQLESIREQLAAEDTENRRKLERLNGRIAELGEHKRGMWSVLGQQCKNILEPKLVSGSAASDAAAPAAAAPTLEAKEAERKLAAREAAVAQAEAKLEARSREAERAISAREAEVSQKEAGVAQREAAPRHPPPIPISPPQPQPRTLNPFRIDLPTPAGQPDPLESMANQPAERKVV